MNLQESIRRILKEETSFVAKLKNLIDTKGIDFASETVGGIKNLAKILNLDLDDMKTQEMLVKNFIYHTKIDDIDVSFIEVRTSPRGNRIINVHFKTNNLASNMISWYVNTICDYMNKELFPFTVTPAWHPVFASRGSKIFLDAEIVNDEEEITEGEITEKCWKGYTQKGMNTMFGKRYPNCVKKKK